HQPLQPSLPPLSLTPDHFNLHNTEHRLIIQALEKTAGNVTRAAEQLGISRRTLHRKIKELKIHEDGDRN
ncbi:MAG: helix-turn-helix domain-containing protein, partial [Verrucomicrobiota bacterium]